MVTEKSELADVMTTETGIESTICWGERIGKTVEQIDRSGVVVAGFYLGGRKVAIQKTSTRDASESTIHRLRLVRSWGSYSAGSIIDFWGSAALDSMLSDVVGRVEDARAGNLTGASLLRLGTAASLVRIEYVRREGERDLKVWDVRVPSKIFQGRGVIDDSL